MPPATTPATTPSSGQDWRPDATEELSDLLGRRILVIDGAMGTAIQRDRPDEAGYRGERFKDWTGEDLQGNNDLLTVTQPALVAADHRAVDLEVVEVLGIHGTDDAGVPDTDQVVHHRGGRVGGVVPPLEGGDDDGVHQGRGVVDLDHPPSLGTDPLTPRGFRTRSAPVSGSGYEPHSVVRRS